MRRRLMVAIAIRRGSSWRGNCATGQTTPDWYFDGSSDAPDAFTDRITATLAQTQQKFDRKHSPLGLFCTCSPNTKDWAGFSLWKFLQVCCDTVADLFICWFRAEPGNNPHFPNQPPRIGAATPGNAPEKRLSTLNTVENPVDDEHKSASGHNGVPFGCVDSTISG